MLRRAEGALRRYPIIVPDTFPLTMANSKVSNAERGRFLSERQEVNLTRY